MRYYLTGLQYQSYWNLEKLYETVIHKKLILANDGLYQLHGDQLYKYKVQQNEINTQFNDNNYNDDNDDNNYIKNYILAPSGYELLKIDKSYRIPYEHNILNISVREYKTHPKAGTKLVIEKTENSIDFFFESTYEQQDNSLKGDLISLLSHLK